MELKQLQQLLPAIEQDTQDKIRDEFVNKKKNTHAAEQELSLQLWDFLSSMPYTYLGACEAVLITLSSATSELVFALYASCFDEEMGSAL